MNTYHVYLKKGGIVPVAAQGYTEDKRAKRFYFHADLKVKDKLTFFSSSDVVGVHKIPSDAEEITAETLAAAWNKMKSHIEKAV